MSTAEPTVWRSLSSQLAAIVAVVSMTLQRPCLPTYLTSLYKLPEAGTGHAHLCVPALVQGLGHDKP